jgi:predicted kinase
MSQPHLVLMAGMPGTGKSTIARALGREFGWPVIDKDVIATALLDAGLPEAQMQPAAYDTCFALTGDLLMQQQTVILDTPAGFPIVTERTRALCERTGAVLRVVLCSADREIRNQRVATRVAMRSQPVGESKTAGYARERFTHLPEDRLEIVTDGDMDETLDLAIASFRYRWM